MALPGSGHGSDFALAASPKPANQTTIKKTFFVIKRFKLLIIM
jgi:hypothetical protein